MAVSSTSRNAIDHLLPENVGGGTHGEMGCVSQHLSVLKGRTRVSETSQIHSIFETNARENYDKNIALIFEESGLIRKCTYKELNDLTNSLARVICQKIITNNVRRNNDGDFIVAVSMSPSDHMIITLLAILKAGAAYLPLDPTFPKSRVEHILREAKPVMVIFDEDQGNFINALKLSVGEFINASKQHSTNSINKDEQLQHLKTDLAIVLYTSGSTGVPKGVRLPHMTILNRLRWQFKTFPYSSTESVCVFKTALTFLDSVSEMWGPLLNGLSVLVVPKLVTQNPEQLVSILEKYKIERLVLVPTLLRSLLMYFDLHVSYITECVTPNKIYDPQKGKKFLNNLKTCISSGETLVSSLAKQFYKYFNNNRHQLCNFYGSTEIMGDVTFHVITQVDQLSYQDKVPIGLPIDNTIIYLLDSDFQPVKIGEVGELFVAGANLAAGYVNGRDPDKFIDNPLAVDPVYLKLYRTGDLAHIENGKVVYEGRIDSQVKIRGYSVDLVEVEKSVNAVEGVEKSVVLCYKPGDINQTIVAFVMVASLNEHQIEAIVKKNLPAYMVPQVILIDSIPLLVNGKTDRQELLKYYENSDTINTGHIDYTGVPESQMSAAKVLLETVASILNKSTRKAVCIDTNFYEIGGNSLNSIYTITILNEKGYYISIEDFIAAVDLRGILDRMSPEQQTFPSLITQPPRYSAEILQEQHKKDTIDMITSSFYQKADLEQWIHTDISVFDYVDLLEKLWQSLLEKQLSFIVKTEAGKSVGVALCFDARDEPEVEVHSKLSIIFKFLESVEGPVRDNKLPPGKGNILHSFMMGTNSTLSAKENVAVIQFMEEEVIKIARSKNFEGILTTNTSPLTQQLCTNIYNYKTYLDCQVNQYVVSDNTKPFGLAPDLQRVLVQWKEI